MNIEDHIERYGLIPDEKDLPLIRNLLTEETAKISFKQAQADTEFMKLCCVQLFSKGNLSDCLLVWQAKTVSMDADGSIDVQLLCGGGLEETKIFLERTNQDEAHEALSHILECEEAGFFEDFSVEDWMEFYQNYYEEDMDDFDID